MGFAKEDKTIGYTTNFVGSFTLDKPLTAAHGAFLRAFAQSRRMKRDPEVTATLPDPVREAVGLPVGAQGEYYVGRAGENDFMNPDGMSAVGILDYNAPPGQQGYKKTGENLAAIDPQPGLWCQWVPTEDFTGIEWDGGEKFYDYTPWLKYLMRHFLTPWGYHLTGSVEWVGEDPDDRGRISVTSGDAVVTQVGITIYE